MRLRYWEDIAEGEVLIAGPWTMTAPEIVEFARQWDPQPMHLDAASDQAALHGGLIASGWHTGAVAVRLLCDALLLEMAGEAGLGMDGIHWPRPVRPGDVLRLEATITGKRASKSRPHSGILTYRCTVLNHRDEPVMLLEGTAMVRRRA